MSHESHYIGDNILVGKIRNDDKEAFKSLYDHYNKRLYYFSIRCKLNNYESEELVQSVFINLWERRKFLDENMEIKSYIYKSAVNYIYNFLRKNAIRNRYIESEISESKNYSDITYEQVFVKDLEKSIYSIIDSLPLQQQQVIRLSRLEFMSHEEIAVKLNITLRTVENHIYRALKTIRKKLGE
jgi:RNA polymerase sigma-70 factor (ECF subfamily)